MLKIQKALINSKFIRNVIIVASGTAMAQVINFLLTPVITRIYGPEAFGLLGTFVAIVGILAPIAALTYPIAIVLPKKNSQAKKIVKLSLYISFCLSCIISFILLIFFDEIINLFNLQLVSSYLFIIPIIIMLYGLLQVNEQWLIRTNQFNVVAKTTVYQTIIVNFSKITLGLFYPFALSLVILQTVGIALRTYLIYYFSDRSIIKKEEFETNITIKDIAKEYKDFPYFRSPQVFLNAVSNSLPVLLLASFFGPAAAGFYALGRQALSTPVQLIGKAVQDVFYPKISEAANKKENLTRIILKSVIALAAIGIIPFGTIILFGPMIFKIVFGAEWEYAGYFAQWIALVSFFTLITRPIIVTIPVLKIQKEFLIFEILSTVIKVSALTFGFYYFKSEIYSVALFSVFEMISYIVLTVYVILNCKRFDKVSTIENRL